MLARTQILSVLLLSTLFISGCGGSSGSGASVSTAENSTQTTAPPETTPPATPEVPTPDPIEPEPNEPGPIEPEPVEPEPVEPEPAEPEPIENPTPPTTPRKRETIRIMAVGDSITHGVLSPEISASWRLPFTVSLDDNDCLYTMVGSQQTNFNHSTFVSPHESYVSQEANHFLTGHTNPAGTNDGIFESLANYTPDIVLLHVGTNDAFNGQNNQQTITEIDQIIAAVLDTGSDVLVANVIPGFTSGHLIGVDERIEQLGELINNYVAQLGNDRLNLVDVRSGYIEDFMQDDGIHPNDAGSDFIAERFFTAYETAGYCAR